MNNRERTLAALNYQPYDRLPLLHFGFWRETLYQWATEGHLTDEEARDWADGNPTDAILSRRLGFDSNWSIVFNWTSRLSPPIEETVVEDRPDGSRVVLNEDGMLVLKKIGVVSIPTEVDHMLKGRQEWQEFFKPRLQFRQDRIDKALVHVGHQSAPFGAGRRELLLTHEREHMYGISCGSLLGVIRNWLGVVGMSYLMADDTALFDEIVETVAELCYQGVRAALATGVHLDFGHFWEDICFRSGPLVNPKMFARKIGPHYKRITDLLHAHGVQLVSLDCDGKIDALVPIWLENGVNVMFPIEVGTWNASIKPWREKHGRELRGVGGMDKKVFAQDEAAIDAEVERLRPLVELGGYIPCPDHRIPLDAKWENVQYYCERMRQVFG
jgi:uroporphyrinogen decarboxylase